jgi:hypothetical protein
MAHGQAIHQGHNDGMTVGINRCWGFETILVQKLHEKKLSDRGQSGEVEPVVECSVSNVLSVVLYASEGVSSQAGKF